MQYPNRLPSSWTLADSYFEERVGLTADEIRDIQDRELRRIYAHAFERSPFYQEKFKAAGLDAGSVKGVDDLGKLPLTTGDEIRPGPDNQRTTFDYMAVAPEAVSLIHSSSGTTGAPKVFPYTGGDFINWASNVATTLWIMGFRKEDTFLAPLPFGEFTGGSGPFLGMTMLGVNYIPIALGPGTTDKILAHITGKMRIGNRVIEVDPALRVNAMGALASFLPRLIEVLNRAGLSSEDILLEKIALGSEPSSEALRDRIEMELGVFPRDLYGLGELYGPGVASECEALRVLHVISDAYIAEILDPETGEATPEGETGELVLTSLQKEARPFLRYRTGDRVQALPQGCSCGMAHYKMGRVMGRIDADDIMMPGGVLVNRTFLEEIVLSVEGTGIEHVITVGDHPTRPGLRRLYIAIEGDMSRSEELSKTIAHHIQVEYSQRPVVIIVPRGTVPRGPGKARRVYTPEEFQALVASVESE